MLYLTHPTVGEPRDVHPSQRGIRETELTEYNSASLEDTPPPDKMHGTYGQRDQREGMEMYKLVRVQLPLVAGCSFERNVRNWLISNRPVHSLPQTHSAMMWWSVCACVCTGCV